MGWFWLFKPSATKHKPAMLLPHVMVATVVQSPQPVVLIAPGVVDAVSSVSIRPQISGIIKSINFTPGQFVNAGDVLFQIDSSTYQANLAQAQANFKEDQVNLTLLKKEKPRYDFLKHRGDVSVQDYDEFIAKLNAQRAAVAADQALIKQNTIALAYATIKTPISGKTGNVLVKPGNLVSASDTDALVTVNQLDPVNVNFYVSQDQLATVLHYAVGKQIIAELYDESQKTLLSTGVLTFVDNTIDPNTGTALLKATISNQDRHLWIGQSVVIKLILTIEPNALTIPIRAVQSDQQGQFVYVLKQNKAIATHIVLDRQINDVAVVRSGLALQDTVLTVFPPNLQDGATVVIDNDKSVTP